MTDAPKPQGKVGKRTSPRMMSGQAMLTELHRRGWSIRAFAREIEMSAGHLYRLAASSDGVPKRIALLVHAMPIRVDDEPEIL